MIIKKLTFFILVSLLTHPAWSSQTGNLICTILLQEKLGLGQIYGSETLNVLEYLTTLNQRYETLTGIASKGRVSEEVRKQIQLAKNFQEKVLPLLQQYESNFQFRVSLDANSKDAAEMKSLAEEDGKNIVNLLKEALPPLNDQMVDLASLGGDKAIVEISGGESLRIKPEKLFDLFKMYSTFARKQGWKINILSGGAGNDSRTLTFEVTGSKAFQYMQFERGIHRFIDKGNENASSSNREKTHTSYLDVKVYKEPTAHEFSFNIDDVQITTMRASGAGGQHVNTTDSAVRAVHNPTGIEVRISNDRSQHANKAVALAFLKAKLYKHHLDIQERIRQEVRKQSVDTNGEERYLRTYDERYDNANLRAILNDQLEGNILNRQTKALAQNLSRLTEKLRNLE